MADHIGFPLLVRPSYVLGGRGMAIVYDGERSSRRTWPRPRRSPPITRSTSTASWKAPMEVDLDALCDGDRRVRGRRAGAHRDGGHPLGRFGLRARRRLRYRKAVQ